MENYTDHLLSRSVIAFRQAAGGVDKQNFYLWAVHFGNHVKNLTMNARKALLILDGYRSRMSLHVFEMVNVNNIIVHALRSYKSEKTRLLYVTVFPHLRPP